jgi:hypothetical protein
MAIHEGPTKVPTDATVVVWRPRGYQDSSRFATATVAPIVLVGYWLAAGMKPLPVGAWVVLGGIAIANVAYLVARYAGRQSEPTLAAGAEGIWWRQRRWPLGGEVRRLPWSAVAGSTARYTWYGRPQLRFALSSVATDSDPTLPRVITVPLGNCRQQGVPVPSAEVLPLLRRLSGHQPLAQPADRPAVPAIDPTLPGPGPGPGPGPIVIRSSTGNVLGLALGVLAIPVGVISLLITAVDFNATRDLRTNGPLALTSVIFIVVGILGLVRRRRVLGDRGRIFVADRRGVWYMTNRPLLQFAPWSAIGWIGEQRDGNALSLLVGSAEGPLPGMSRAGQVRVPVVSSYFGVSSTTNLQRLLRDLYELSGHRVEVR